MPNPARPEPVTGPAAGAIDPRRFVADLGAIAGYTILLGLFFWPLFFEPGTHVPKGGGDLASFLYPVYSYAARSIQAGVLPLWNPYLYTGSPFAADMQSGLFYPINLIAFVFGRPFTYQTLEGLAVVHYWLAGVFAYVYLRVIGLPAIAAFGGGIVFAYSGFLVAHLGHLNMVEAAVWLPLILAGFHLALARRSWRWTLAAGLCFGVSILPGHVQINLYTGLFLMLYAAWWAGRSGSWRGLARPAGFAALTFLVAAGVAAIQILPSFELTRLSVRSDITFAKAVEFAASPRGLITWLAPHFFGDDAARYWGIPWSLTEVYGYAGVVTLIVAGLAVVAGAGRTWGPVGFFGLMAVLFGLLSIAEHTPLFGWLYRFFPGFDKVRAAGRFTLIVDWSIAVLAAYGLATLRRPWPARIRPLATGYLWLLTGLGLAVIPLAGIVYYALLTSQDKDPVIFQRVALASDSVNLGVAFLWLGLAVIAVQRWRRPPGPILPALAIALIAIDLFGANLRFNPTGDNVVASYQRDDAVAYLRAQPGTFRIDTETGIGEIWPPDAALLFGLEDVLGIYNPMQLADHQRYWAGLGSRSVPAYDLLNARYLIARPDAPLDPAKFRPVQGAGPLVIHENVRALPRAFLVPRAEILPAAGHLDRLKSADFDPRALVLLTEARPLPPGEPAGGDVAAIDRPSPNELTISTDAAGPAYLFVAEVFYPGWRATVDGAAVEIPRANGIFRAIVLPPGRHEVRFHFDPPLFRLGAALTALTLAGLVALGIWSAIGWRRA